MESKWKTTSLKELGVQLIDCDHKTPKEVENGVPYIGIPQMDNGRINFDAKPRLISEEDYITWTRKAAPQFGDVILSRRCNSGETVYVPKNKKFALGQNLVLLRPTGERLHPEYLRWAVQSTEWWNEVAKYLNPGAIFDSLKCREIPKFKIPEPPKLHQIKISDMLSSINDKIELNQKTNQTLEKMAQTLFKSWFVDFDPVFDNALAKADFKLDNLPNEWPEALLQRAKLRLQVLQQNPTLQTELTQNLSVTSNQQQQDQISQTKHTHQHFPSEFELIDEPSIGINGWIPKGWELSNTDNEFQIKGGSTPSTKNSDFWDGGEIHWTSPKDLSGNNTKIMLDTSRKITEAGLTKITSGLLPVDTILMSSRAPVGYLALAKIPVAINQGYIAITDAKTLSSEYTIQWLDSVMDEIKSISGGTTFAEISKKTFRSIQLVIPKKGIVDAYTQIAKANYQRITANVQEIKTLTETRDYLLPKLISGEINLNGVEDE